MPWSMLETVGAENKMHFSGAAQKINHELAKMSISNPNFGDPIDQQKGIEKGRASMKRDILYALGIKDDEDEGSSSDDSTETSTAKSSDTDDNEDKHINYGG